MKTVFVFWKIACLATVAIPGILLFYRDWKADKKKAPKLHHRLTRWSFGGLIVAFLAALAAIWLDPFLQTKIAETELVAAKPHPVVEIREQSESSIVLEISSPTTNTRLMENLSLSFDIPGKNGKCRILRANRAEYCSITNAFLASVNDDTVAESVRVFCKTLLPSGFIQAQIDYERTRRRPVFGSIKAGKTNMSYVPVMDLRDYTPCLYTWLHNGQQVFEKSVVSLTNLAYIAEDNENMYRTFRMEGDEWTNYPPEIRSAGRDIWTREHFRKIEEQRKHW